MDIPRITPEASTHTNSKNSWKQGMYVALCVLCMYAASTLYGIRQAPPVLVEIVVSEPELLQKDSRRVQSLCSGSRCVSGNLALEVVCILSY